MVYLKCYRECNHCYCKVILAYIFKFKSDMMPTASELIRRCFDIYDNIGNRLYAYFQVPILHQLIWCVSGITGFYFQIYNMTRMCSYEGNCASIDNTATIITTAKKDVTIS